MTVVSGALLEQLAAEAPSQPKRQSNGQAMAEPEGTEAVRRLCAEHDTEIVDEGPYKNGYRLKLSCCPLDSSHKDAAVFLNAGRPHGFNCFHESCKGKKWEDVLQLWGVEQEPPQRAKKTASRQSAAKRPEPPVEEPEPAAVAEGDDHQIAEDLFQVAKLYIVAQDGLLYIFASYILHTHSIEAASFTPYLYVTSAEKGCGKTRVLEVAKPLVRNPLFTVNISAAALARMVDQGLRTALIDETDTQLGPKANKETAETLRGTLNSGYHRGETYVRMVGTGANMEPREFSTFCPKILAGLGSLPTTIASRTIPFNLRRAHRNECRRFRPDGKGASAKQLSDKLEKLRSRAARWAKLHFEQIADCEPDYPAEFTDRQCDISESLLAIANVLGDPWPERISKALITVFGSLAAEDSSMGVLLLGHVRKVFLDKDTELLHTKDLIAALCAIPEAPWAEWNEGKSLNDRSLAKLLRDFEIISTTVRAPDPAKGYKLKDFSDAFDRYLQPVCLCPACDCHEACDGLCNASESNEHAGCNAVTAKKGGGGKGEGKTPSEAVN